MNHKELERWYRLKVMQKAAKVLAIAAIIVFAAGYAASRWLAPTAPDLPGPSTGTGMEIENFSYSVPGINPWELKAVSASVSKELDKVSLVKPSVLYKGGKGGEIRLSAESGKLDKKSNNVIAQGDVKVYYGDMSLAAAEIGYSDTDKTAESSSSVSLEGGDLKVAGKGLKLSVDKEEIVIENDVKALISNIQLFGARKKVPM
jgi:LPS export ABC transporter protein LptC